MIELSYPIGQIIAETMIAFTIIYVGYRLFWDFVIYEVDYEELEQSSDPCPTCGTDLYVEYGKYANMYRCKSCRFEGMREPLIYGLSQACKVRYERIKRKVNNVR